MHELGLATNLLQSLEDLARLHHAERIETVEVELGILQQVVPEAFQMAFNAAAAGTPAEGARLVLTEVQPVAECRACGERFGATIDDYLCPRCGQADVRIVAGQDLVLKSVTLATGDSAAA